tara:strand:- start:254 stop:538 length:285 start_codon:yes stop_codon:yes gene_type:complete
MPLGKMTAKQLGRGGALHDAVAMLDPTSVVREMEKDGLLKDIFSDDDLINTHPVEMTDPMLKAAQARINEDEEFARRYRAGTDYKPRKLRDLNF